ncbi:MAG: XRE family transcriptional regulator [Anaerolineae bacterium]|nr:MAG: XRE family transcriptional regulator [Anaerolineae bacterium]
MSANQDSFREWINAKYIEWMMSMGKKRPLYAFAEFLGVTQATLSLWMSGRREPNHDHTFRLAKLFGPEIFVITKMFEGLDSRHKFVSENWQLIDEKDREQIIEIIERGLERKSNKLTSLKSADETGS